MNPIIEFYKNNDFTVFDIETTGYSPAANGKIIEIGAVKISNGKIIDRFSEFVNPHILIPKNIVRLTKINNAMVRNSQDIKIVLNNFLKFADSTILVAHNSQFDYGFINYFVHEPLSFYVIDTLPLARKFLNAGGGGLKNISLSYNIEFKNAHRAISDAELTSKVLKMILEIITPDELFSLIDVSPTLLYLILRSNRSLEERYKKTLKINRIKSETKNHKLIQLIINEFRYYSFPESVIAYLKGLPATWLKNEKKQDYGIFNKLSYKRLLKIIYLLVFNGYLEESGKNFFKITDKGRTSISNNQDFDLLLPPKSTFKKGEVGETKKITLKLFKEGNSILQISQLRDLKISTIETHLAFWVARKEISIEDLMDKETINKIKNVIQKNYFRKLTDIKRHLPNNISFGQIRAVMEHIKLNDQF